VRGFAAEPEIPTDASHPLTRQIWTAINIATIIALLFINRFSDPGRAENRREL
jgi:hypothetical protein